ncbi:MAG: protein kinase [Bryobacterales bacterium]|nr:protein kinase [Bryobacterales bacterium]
MTGALFGHFRILEKLGEGGMGQVYKAQDLNLDRFVAVKILRSDATKDAVRRRRFELEAKTASSLQHPNIVSIYDIGWENDVEYIVMEYLGGKTLDAVISGKPLPPERALRIAEQIAGAVSKAHGAGIVHRDLKPSNVMVLPEDFIKILDFGLAKLTETGDSSEDTITHTQLNLTTEGMVIGTAAYMSPEQVEGRKIDARSDIFSFGAVLYEMLRGKRAFASTSQISTLSAVLTREPEVLSDVPDEIQRVVRRCLRKEADQRFQSMADVRMAIGDLRDDLRTGSLSSSARMAAARATRRFRLWWLLAVVGALAVTAGVLSLWQGLSTSPPLHPVQLTSYSGVEDSPTLSPDGSQFAFQWSGPNGDNIDIYVRLVDGGDPLRLTNDLGDDTVPAWSPDGRWIAYRHIEQGRADIRLVSPLGGRPRKLLDLVGATFGASHCWAPDSRRLVVSMPVDGRESQQLLRVDAQTGELLVIGYPEPAANQMDLSCAVSPDGQKIAFLRMEDRQSVRLLLVPFQGGWVTDTGVMVASATGLAWTPDGLSVLIGTRIEGLDALWRIPMTKGFPARPVRLTGAGDGGSSPAFAPPGSRHGARLIYTRAQLDIAVVAAEFGPDGRFAAEPRRVVSETARMQEAQVSPDGKQIAVVSERSGPQQVWLFEEGSVDARQVSWFTNMAPGALRWAPNSRDLVFDVLGSGKSDLYTMSSVGGSPRRLTMDSSNEARPSFSADGKFVYFRSDKSGSRELWKMPFAGGEWIQVTRDGGFEAQETVDGRNLIYIKGANGVGLYERPVPGGPGQPIAPAARAGLWSYANGWVAWFDVPDGTWGMYKAKVVKVMNLATRDTWVAGSVTSRLAVNSSQVSLSPDHKRFYFVRRAEPQADLVLVDNFR